MNAATTYGTANTHTQRKTALGIALHRFGDAIPRIHAPVATTASSHFPPWWIDLAQLDTRIYPCGLSGRLDLKLDSELSVG